MQVTLQVAVGKVKRVLDRLVEVRWRLGRCSRWAIAGSCCRSRTGARFDTAATRRTARGHGRHHGGARRRRARRAADRRQPAGRDLRRAAEPALSGRRRSALHRARQSGAQAGAAGDGGRLGRLPVGAGHARGGAALSRSCAIRGSISTARPSIAPSRDSTRGSCSTSAITSTASCIRCASATCATSASPRCCFPTWATATTEPRDQDSRAASRSDSRRSVDFASRSAAPVTRKVSSARSPSVLIFAVCSHDAIVGKDAGDSREQSRAVAGDDREHVERAALVGVQSDRRGDREVLEMARQPPGCRRIQRCPADQPVGELMLDDS